MRHLRRILASAVLFVLAMAALPADATQFSRQNYFTAGGVPTNASFVGPWIPCNNNGAIGFLVVMTGTSAPVGTWGVDVTNDNQPASASDLGATPVAATAVMTSNNPSGNSANLNFIAQYAPAPPAKWIRFKYTATSGGSASNLLKVSVSSGPPGAP